MKKIFAMACLAISALGFSAQAADKWDGNIDTEWVADEYGYYLIYTAEELAGLAFNVNRGIDYNGETFLLMDDIDLNNHPDWTPIGQWIGIHSSGEIRKEHYFRGTFDGQNHTVSNMYINFDKPNQVNEVRVTSGLFGAIQNATIKNITVRDSYIYQKTNAYNNFAGAIVGISNSGTIDNCSSIHNNISVHSPYQAFGKRGYAYAGGICGACGNKPTSASKIGGFTETTNTTIEDCAVAGNSITGSAANTTKTPAITSGSTQKDNTDYDAQYPGNPEGAMNALQQDKVADIAAINDNTIKKNNFGVNSGETANYYLNPQTGVATDYNYYVFMGVDDSKAQTGSLRQNSTYTDGALMMPYNYNGYNYKLYPSGKVAVTITFYLEGFKGNWSDAGFFIERIYNTETGADIQKNLIATYGNDGLDKDGNATYNANTDRFMRTEVYELIMPANVTSIAYSTYKIVPSSIESTAQEAVQVYGTNGALVVNAAAATELVVVSIDGRVVYNDMVEGNARIELPAGIYIANNHKVVVR